MIRQGELGADAFVILSGYARVVRDGREVARLGAGQFFGEVAMLDGRPRTADVVAESRLRCIALSRETVKRALAAEPDLAWRVLEVLAGRIPRLASTGVGRRAWVDRLRPRDRYSMRMALPLPMTVIDA